MANITDLNGLEVNPAQNQLPFLRYGTIVAMIV